VACALRNQLARAMPNWAATRAMVLLARQTI